MTTSNNEFAALLGKVFTDATAENLKPSTADDERECPCKKNLAALAKKLKSDMICRKFGKCRGK